MTPFIDIHTHSEGSNVKNRISIRNIPAEERKSEQCYSMSFHPWHIIHYLNYDFSGLSKLNDKNCFAIGEIGLDKLRPVTYDLQKKILLKIIRNIPDPGIPLIVHCVKAANDLTQTFKASKLKNPIIIHGFNNNENVLQTFLKEDYYISLGKILFGKKEKADLIINKIPKNRLFLETDDGKRSIEEVYERAASLLKISVDELKKIILKNAKKIFTQIQ